MSLRSFIYQKNRHLTTSAHYNFTTRFRIGAETLSRGIFYLLFIACMFLMIYTQNYFLASFISGVFLVRYLTQLFIINKTGKLLEEKSFIFSLIFYDIYLPLLSLYLLTIGKIGTKKQTMWR